MSNNFHAKIPEELFREFETSEKGLSKQEAEIRLKKEGKNIIKKTHKLRPLKILFLQFHSFLILILMIAAGISFFIGHFFDGMVISAIVLLNAVIGFTQQYKAEKAIFNLKKLIIPRSKVMRGERVIEISSTELVPGDILILEAGDRINADCRIIEAENTQTNEAILTGESLPVEKIVDELADKTNLAERKNMLFTGTQLVRGSAKALVVTTGMNTEFGKIAGSLQEIEIQETPMQKRLDKFSKQIGVFILLFVFFVMLLGIFDKFEVLDMFLTAVALAVSAIPEGLPTVLTISFAISSLLMSKKNVIIRRLPAVESLGSVTVICSDKTGTITEEKMEVQKFFVDGKFYSRKDKEVFFGDKKINVKKSREFLQLLKTSVLCNNARFEKTGDEYDIIGDPTEASLVSIALDLDVNKKTLIENEPSLKKFDFNSKRRMMSVVRQNGRNKTIYSKGAIEKILEISSSELINGQIKNLTEKRKKELIEKSKEMEKDALRVLAFAYKNFSQKEEAQEKGLIFVGLEGMIDPPRKEVKKAVKECHNAGIDVKMITGDSAVTAVAVAKQIGIKGNVMIGSEIDEISDSELINSFDKVSIFARISPTQKLRITKLLQKNKEVVAITGDGVNDSLALKQADIGIAMGKRGTDVAREVSDVVLVDDNFASIVEGVRQGRKTYDNIKKFAKYLLAVNFSEIFLVLTALFFGLMFGIEKWFLPLLPLHILWINLVTDSFPALSLVFEREENVMKTKPRSEKSLLDDIWKFVFVAGMFTFGIKFSMYVLGIMKNIPVAEVRTMVLTTAVLFELFFVYTCRSDTSLLDRKIFSNKWLNYAVLFSIGLHLILLYTPLAVFFQVVPLSLNDWIMILPFAVSGLVVFEIWKFVKKN